MEFRFFLYSEALGELSRTAYSCGICGVHGKTTTTGLAGTMLKEIDLPSQVLAGSIISSFGNSCTMTSSEFSNSDEAEKNILSRKPASTSGTLCSFCPQKIILTSVESDHQDYYPTFADIQNAFVDYICKLPENGDLIFALTTKALARQPSLQRKNGTT